MFAATERLERARCDSPRLDAELLMAHSLHLTRTQLYARCHQVLSTSQEDVFAALVERRAAREPLAYIVGHKEFYRHDFVVDRRVLIPRPETEHLVEQALAEVRRWAPNGPFRLVDVGAGSGAIAVSLAVALPGVHVLAADASPEALAVAADHVRRHRAEGRVQLVQSDLLDSVPGPLDLICANLPYISAAEWPDLAPEITRFEPKTALLAGPDGLDAIRRLIAQAAARRPAPRALLLEIGSTQGAAVTALARVAFPHAEVFIVKDYAGLDRVVGVRP